MLILPLTFILTLVTSQVEDALVCAFALAHLRATDFLAIMTLIQFRGMIQCSTICSARARMGLRAESARAVTGRRCPYSGKGEDFLTGQPDFFTETAVTPEWKVEKLFPRWEINCHGDG